MHKLNNLTGMLCVFILGLMVYNMYAAKKENTGNFMGWSVKHKRK